MAASWTRQDQLARRIGRRLLFWSFYVLIWSVTLTIVYRGALWLIENELLPLPKRAQLAAASGSVSVGNSVDG